MILKPHDHNGNVEESFKCFTVRMVHPAVKTVDGVLIRPLSKLAVLDMESRIVSESQPLVSINGGEGVLDVNEHYSN